jgi:hypothetical protein
MQARASRSIVTPRGNTRQQDFALIVEMNGLEEQAENVKARDDDDVFYLF